MRTLLAEVGAQPTSSLYINLGGCPPKPLVGAY